MIVMMRSIRRCASGVHAGALSSSPTTCAYRTTPLAPYTLYTPVRSLARGGKRANRPRKAAAQQKFEQAAKQVAATAKPAAPVESAASSTMSPFLSGLFAAAAAAVVAGIIYTWSTLVEMLQKLDRARQNNSIEPAERIAHSLKSDQNGAAPSGSSDEASLAPSAEQDAEPPAPSPSSEPANATPAPSTQAAMLANVRTVCLHAAQRVHEWLFLVIHELGHALAMLRSSAQPFVERMRAQLRDSSAVPSAVEASRRLARDAADATARAFARLRAAAVDLRPAA